MKNNLARVPFFFLLISLLSGIVLQYYTCLEYIWSITFILTGILVMLFSFILHATKHTVFQSAFGIGVFFTFVGIGATLTQWRQEQVEFTFQKEKSNYRAIVLDYPQNKPKTQAYKLYLPDVDKKIICYIKSDSLHQQKMSPGDELIFRGQIRTFNKIGDFDYPVYMHNKGFCGQTFLNTSTYFSTGVQQQSLAAMALHIRQRVLSFYHTLGFSDHEYAFLSALTLGYQDDLPDAMKQEFRAAGVVHVLAISGLHVGIIYFSISLLFGFVRKRSRFYWFKPLLIILCLWLYAFIVGLPPSAVRATSMLTVFCVAEIFRRRHNPFNSLYIAAFFMLLANPFMLFDIGFQLSFVSVFGILYAYPKVSKLWTVKNKILRYIWQSLCLSLVAQLAVFPLCLYYFGTFPVYFFIANLIIVPLVPLVIYSTLALGVAYVLSVAFTSLSAYFYFLPVHILKILILVIRYVISGVAQFPYAEIKEVNISAVSLVIIYVVVSSFLLFIIHRKPKLLIISLSAFLGLIINEWIDWLFSIT